MNNRKRAKLSDLCLIGRQGTNRRPENRLDELVSRVLLTFRPKYTILIKIIKILTTKVQHHLFPTLLKSQKYFTARRQQFK